MQFSLPMIHHIIFLRHGQSTANRDQILQGQMDSPLSEQGLREAELLANYWKSEGVMFDLIISSPLKRAFDTARVISQFLSILIEPDQNWKERNFGKAEGHSYDDVRAMRKEIDSYSIFEPAFEDGESEWDLNIRAGEAIRTLIRRPAGNYLVVTHGSIFNAVLNVILGIPPRTSSDRTRFQVMNSAYSTLEYDGDLRRWSILSLNCTRHLGTIPRGQNHLYNPSSHHTNNDH